MQGRYGRALTAATLIIPLAISLFLAGGCASVLTNRYLQSNDPARLRPTSDGKGAILALDLFSLDQISEHPWMTLGALGADAAMGYGIYALGDEQGWWGGDDNDTTTTTTTTQVRQPGSNISIGDNNSQIEINVYQPGGDYTFMPAE